MAATKRPAGINFDKILQSLKDDIQEMKQEYQESSLPISDDNKNLHQFCDRIEFILKFGIRERSVLGSQRDVWQYFCKCLSGRRNIVEGLKIVKANRELKTGVGRSRCFIRYCLVHQCFADVLQQCVDNRNVTSQFYLPEALMHDASLSSSLLGGLYQLCDVPFDLPPTGHDLDVSWPTFARHGSSIWRPPSRTVSMSSLSSFSSLLSEAISYQSPPVHSNMAPVGEDEPTHECPSSPVSPTSPSHTSADTSLKGTLEEVSELHQRLAHLEDDNATLRASCVSLQLKLDQVQQDTTLTSQECAVDKSSSVSPEGTSTDMCEESSHTCSKCSQLSEELLLSQNRCSELENLQQRLENQVKELEKQVQSLESKEKDNLCKISTLEPKLLEAGSNEIDSDGGHITDRVNVKLQESLATDTSLETSSQTEVTEDMERCRQKLAVLEKEYEALQEKCRAAEIEKSTMRSNIHKVSANWFERKARLSESDSESSHNEDVSPQSESIAKAESNLIKEQDYATECHFWFKKMKDIPKLLAEISFLSGKLDLAEKISTELRKRVREYENVIDDQEIIIHGLKDQLDTYFTDNQKMSKQLSALTKLFEDIECSEKTHVNKVNPPESNSTVANNLPSGDDFKEMANSLSKTYIKLKELILEKKSLVTEIERLNVLNVELQHRVHQQENRLISVSDALHTTWMLISDIREHYEEVHNQESILRYELKEKRELLHRLREELECSREQWHKIRQMNSKSEEEWNSIKEELDERRRAASSADSGVEMQSSEGASALQSDTKSTSDFEPPVDLLLDMAIEYGVIEADDETSTSLVAALAGEDMHASRLQDLEEQCSHLYQKLMASTSRSLTLASRLTALHQHYGSSDEEDDDDEDEDEYGEEEEEEEEEEGPFETEVMSPEPESYDTAYVSEADTGSASGMPGTLSEEETSTTNTGGNSMEDPSSSEVEHVPEVEDDLCRGLINFLPRKIEILRRDNQKLEERYHVLQEDKLRSEAQLTATLETERMIRQQLEEKLEHLGKCVDELKLERNGQICEAEEKLRQKAASFSEKEKEYETLQEDLSSLQDKFEERGKLLQIANDRVNQLEKELLESKSSVQDTLAELNVAKKQATEFKDLHEQITSEYKQLKEEILALQQEITDMKFQLSSHSLERDAAVKAEVALKSAQKALSDTQSKLGNTEETTAQLNEDNTHLKEKIIQLLSRRVRVCDDCFSVHAELATIIASPAGHSSSITEATSLPERKPETLHKGRPLPIGTHLPDDEEFSVISDDELQSSRLSSSPSNGSPGSNEVVTETRATTDILTPASLTDSPPTNAEAWVGAGTRVLVPVDLPAGVTLHWHFSSEPKSVSFAVLHQPPQSEKSGDQVPQTSQQRVLIPTTRVASAEGATVKGRLQTKQPGVYTLVFDNSCSRFTAKKVTYSLSLENQVKSLTSASVASSSSPPSQPEVSLPAP